MHTRSSETPQTPPALGSTRISGTLGTEHTEGVRGGMGLPADEVPTEAPSVGPRNCHDPHPQRPSCSAGDHPMPSAEYQPIPLISVNEVGGMYCVEPGTSSSASGHVGNPLTSNRLMILSKTTVIYVL